MIVSQGFFLIHVNEKNYLVQTIGIKFQNT